MMSPYREVEHTADWALQVWAPTREALFVEAAKGMYALAGATPSDARAGPLVRLIELSGGDYEALLVAWLQELLYDLEAEGNVYTEFRIQTLTPTHLQAEVIGASIGQVTKAIKAVTYHNLDIRDMAEGFEVAIVFDV